MVNKNLRDRKKPTQESFLRERRKKEYKKAEEWYSFEHELNEIKKIAESADIEKTARLVEALKNPDTRIRSTAARGLFDIAKKVKMNKKVLMPIILAIDDNDSNVRSTLRAIIEFALENNNRLVEGCIKEVGKKLECEQLDTKRKAIKTLERLLKEGISIDAAIPYVIKSSKDEDEDLEIKYFAKKVLDLWERTLQL